MAKYEDRAFVRRQPAEPAVELIAIRDAEEFVASRHAVHGKDLKIGGSSTFSCRLGDADMRQEAVHPRVESVRIAEARKVTPGDHQRVLQGILGPIHIPEDPVRDREESVAAELDQVHECNLITTLCRLDEVAVHRHHR